MLHEAFELEFPAGTWVQDLATGEHYIQRTGGNKRMILPEERGSYKELLATETGELVP